MYQDPKTEIIKLQEAISELSSLNDIASAIGASMAVEEITEIIIDKSLKHIKASQGGVFLINTEQDLNQNLQTFIRRTSDSPDEIPIHFNMNLTGWMIKYKKILMINSPDEKNPFPNIDLNSLGIRTLLAAPLLTNRGLIGVLAIFNKNGGTSFIEKDRRFLGILGSQCAQVIEGARLRNEEEKLIALKEELQIARSIQKSFLPTEENFENIKFICGTNIPAREVGGDFFDVVTLDDNRIFVSIGDVVGKGVPAALLMANVMAIQRAQLKSIDSFSPEKLANSLNQVICDLNKPNQFISALFGIIDISSGLFEFVNAGHLPPMVIDKNSEITILKEADIVLGILGANVYKSQKINITNGSNLFLYTDGLTEATNSTKDEFGIVRLIEILRKNQCKSANDICSEILAKLNEFRGSTEQNDDATMILVKI